MRTTFLLLTFLITAFGFSQNLVTGFYQVSKDSVGVKVEGLGADADVFVISKPIFILKDIQDMYVYLDENNFSHSIAFELNKKGAKKLKNFTPKNYPAQIALVLDGKCVSNASIYNIIPNGMFVLNGLDEKKAKAVFNKLKE